MSKPFEGLKVLDLSTFVAAPCVCRLLADLGAEVVKIERNTGDGWRGTSTTYCPAEFSFDENPVYDYYNAGKKHITVNLKDPEGHAIFDKLLDQADIFVTNNRLQGLKRMGIDYDSVKEAHPRLIYAMVEGYGEKGEDANTAAFDTTAFWARCGMLPALSMRNDDGECLPIYPPSSVGDSFTAFVLLSEINAALYSREKTGRGQMVKAGLFRSGIFAFGTMQVTAARPYGNKFPKYPWDHSTLAGSYKCKDGKYLYIATGVVSETYKKICIVCGHPEWIDDPRYNTPATRYTNRKEFYTMTRTIFLTKDREEWMKICKDVDLAYGIVNSFEDVSEDPQALANGYLEDVTFRTGRTLKMSACPLSMGDLEGEDMSVKPAPLPGADNKAVLLSLGYTEDEIEKLTESGVIKPIY